MCAAAGGKSLPKKALSSAVPYGIVAAEAMSEFKFACPVCGQHITADSSTSGGQVECPTCFQKIVVPQAPTSAETKFILSASQVSKPRPASAEAASRLNPLKPSRTRTSIPVVITLLILLCAAGAALYMFRDQVFPSNHQQARATTKQPGKHKGKPAAASVNPVPTNIVWSLDLTNATFPETTAGGRIQGSGFTSERASLEGGTLSLRQGKGWPPELGIAILLRARPGEDFTGKTVEVAPNQPPPVPRLILRWKDDQQQPAKQEFNGGYALKLAFGQPANGHRPGKIYLCLPDAAKSVVAGTFDAELRKPKPSQPKGSKPRG
jgi:DNA-directed RNA polymerase subunit RPC12/RpoP